MNLRSAGQWFLTHRKRFAPAVMVIGALVIGSQLFNVMPRTTELRFNLGPDHDEVVEVQISYVQHDVEIVGARFVYPEGAPRSIRHVVELTPGRYEIRAELQGLGGPQTVLRAIEVPADGEVHIDLFEQALASLSRVG